MVLLVLKRHPPNDLICVSGNKTEARVSRPDLMFFFMVGIFHDCHPVLTKLVKLLPMNQTKENDRMLIQAVR